MTRRAAALLLLGSGFVFVLASTSGLAGAAAGRASAARISAHLTRTSLSSARAGSVNLVYEFSEPSGSFSYLLSFKNGSTWQTIARLKKKGFFEGSNSMTVKKIFAGKTVEVGSYRLKLSADGGSKLLSFKVVGGTTAGGSGVSPAAPPATWSGEGCLGYKTASSANFVCDYRVEAPFSLTGYSVGGTSTLFYEIQCRKDTAPPQKVVIFSKVWYTKSQRVRGDFKVYGARATRDAAGNCDAAQGDAPVLIVSLEMGKLVGRAVLNVRIDSAVPWGT